MRVNLNCTYFRLTQADAVRALGVALDFVAPKACEGARETREASRPYRGGCKAGNRKTWALHAGANFRTRNASTSIMIPNRIA